jgi:PqqD family protein of HPr-rel-A system
MLEQIGGIWAAYSPLSGGSHLLNDESAAILEAVEGQPAVSVSAICATLAQDCGLTPFEVEGAIGSAWDDLIGAGLLYEHLEPAATAE